MPTRRTPRRTVVLFVRHGETPTTGRVLPGRSPGLHLSERGVAQAEQVAERLASARLAALYASPLERAQETAGPTAVRTGLPVVTEPGLLEADVGDWTGTELATLARRREWAQVQRSPSTFRFPGGESFTEMQARLVATVERLRAAHPGGVIACFSHADPIKAALAHALGTPLDLLQRIAIDTCSVSVVAYPPAGAPAVLTVNSTAGPLGPAHG